MPIHPVSGRFRDPCPYGGPIHFSPKTFLSDRRVGSEALMSWEMRVMKRPNGNPLQASVDLRRDPLLFQWLRGLTFSAIRWFPEADSLRPRKGRSSVRDSFLNERKADDRNPISCRRGTRFNCDSKKEGAWMQKNTINVAVVLARLGESDKLDKGFRSALQERPGP